MRLITTPRSEFRTCLLDENLHQIAEKNVDKFDFMPVVSTQGVILGIVELAAYFDAPAPTGKVSDFTEQLGERHLIGADASILDFILDADQRPFRFVVSQNGIIGLVSLSDLQRFPVRPVLFSLVTALEIKAAATIRSLLPQSDAWLEHISNGRRMKVREEIAKASAKNGIVDPLLFTQFSDKRDIISKAFLRESPKRQKFTTTMKKIQALRDDLAHANEYASTTKKAADVCRTVRSVFEMFNLLDHCSPHAT